MITEFIRDLQNSNSDIVVVDDIRAWEADYFWWCVRELATELENRHVCVLALYCKNTAPWLIADLACRLAGAILLPLPPFWPQSLYQHALTDANADYLLTDVGAPPVNSQWQFCKRTTATLFLWKNNATITARPLTATDGIITYTSGTTQTPQKIFLPTAATVRVTRAIKNVIADMDIRRHVCVNPLAVLLENIAGAHVALLAGGTIVMPSMTALGFDGTANVNANQFAQTIANSAGNSMVVSPALLKALLVHTHAELEHQLKFVAVGSAKIAPDLIMTARQRGIPAYEGYGLSECASVVSLNTPMADKIGSVGRLLEHVKVDIATDGEIYITPEAGKRIASGDIGHLDEDGFLHIHGRKKNIYITAYGRNFSPEWVEAELTASSVIKQAAVFGDHQDSNIALIFATTIITKAVQQAVKQAVEKTNQRLPVYAHISHWQLLTCPFSPTNGQTTATGKIRRDAIASAYADTIDRLLTKPLGEIHDNTTHTIF